MGLQTVMKNPMGRLYERAKFLKRIYNYKETVAEMFGTHTEERRR